MAFQFRLSNDAAKSMADGFTTELDSGSTAAEIDIRTGSQPADPDTAATGTLLSTNVMSDPSFGAATDGAPGGLITANSINDDASADAGGTAGYFRMRATGTGADDVADGDVDTASADMIFNTTTFTMGSTVSITSFTATMPET